MTIGQVNIMYQMSCNAQVTINMGTETVQDYRIVDNEAKRLALSTNERKIGLLVFEVESGDYFILSGGTSNDHWAIAPLLNVKPWVISRTSQALLLDQHHVDDGLPPVLNGNTSTVTAPVDNFTIAATKAEFSVSEEWQAVYFTPSNLSANGGFYLYFSHKNMNRDDGAAGFGFTFYHDGETSFKAGFHDVVGTFDNPGFLEEDIELDILQDQLLAVAVKELNGSAQIALFGGKDATAASAPLLSLDTGVSFAGLDAVSVYMSAGTSIVQHSEPATLFDGIGLISNEAEDTSIYPDNRAGKTFRVENASPNGSPSAFGLLFNAALVSFDLNENPVIQPVQVREEDITQHVMVDSFATKSELTPLATKAELTPLATKSELTDFATKSELTPLATKAELTPLATKSELAALATKDELATATSTSAKEVSGGYQLVAGDVVYVVLDDGDESLLDPIDPQVGDTVTVIYQRDSFGSKDQLNVLGIQLHQYQSAVFMYYWGGWKVIGGTVLSGLATGTLANPPSNLKPGERWLDTTDSAAQPIVRVSTVITT